MSLRTIQLASVALVVVAASGGVAWAIGFELGKNKEELGLKYDVAVQDHGTGRVTVVVTLADEGTLKPLTAVQLDVPGEDGTGRPDLSLAIATREEEGAHVARVHLLRTLAERAEIRLQTRTLDGKETPLTWYYHTISVAEHMRVGERETR
jgi:hypothetical protein